MPAKAKSSTDKVRIVPVVPLHDHRDPGFPKIYPAGTACEVDRAFLDDASVPAAAYVLATDLPKDADPAVVVASSGTIGETPS
jgi:hypothetical protein